MGSPSTSGTASGTVSSWLRGDGLASRGSSVGRHGDGIVPITSVEASRRDTQGSLDQDSRAPPISHSVSGADSHVRGSLTRCAVRRPSFTVSGRGGRAALAYISHSLASGPSERRIGVTERVASRVSPTAASYGCSEGLI